MTYLVSSNRLAGPAHSVLEWGACQTSFTSPLLRVEVYWQHLLDDWYIGLTYCWWLKSGDQQLMLVVHPILFRVSYIPGGARFQPSTGWNGKNTVVPVERSLFAACAGCFCIVNVLPWKRKKNAFLCKVHLDRNEMDLYLSLASCFKDQKDNTHDCKVNVDDASDS